MFSLFGSYAPDWSYPHRWPGMAVQKFKTGHNKARTTAAKARIAKRKAKR
jgi:hypothetical protein